MNRVICKCVPIILMLMLITASGVIAQLSTTTVYWVRWNSDASRFATVNAEGLTLYDIDFQPINSRLFTSAQDYRSAIPRFSPDGSRILILNEIWDSTTLETLVTFVWECCSPQWSADSRTIVVWGRNDTYIVSAEDGSILRQIRLEQSWSPDNQYFSYLGRDQVVITDANSGVKVAEYLFPNENLAQLAWSPDSRRLAVSSVAVVPLGTFNSYPAPSTEGRAYLHSLYIIDISTHDIIRLEGFPATFNDFAWSSDGMQFAAATRTQHLAIFDVNGTLIEDFTLPPYNLTTMTYSAFGGRLLIGARESEIIPSSVRNAGVQALSDSVQFELDNALQILVPDASLEQLQAIANLCIDSPTVRDGLLSGLTESGLADFIAEVRAASDMDIPPGCAADLLAVAELIQ